MSVEIWLNTLEGRGDLGPRAARVIRFLACEPHLAAYASVREIAERTGANSSTVVRMAQQLGYAGWPDLREDLRERYVASMTGGVVPEQYTGAAGGEIIGQALRQDAVNLRALATAESVEEIRLVADAIGAASRTFVLGLGLTAPPARLLCHLGTILGYELALLPESSTLQAAKIAAMGEGDCLVVVNAYRRLRAERALTGLARERGVTVCVLTDMRTSTLSTMADHLVIAPCAGALAVPTLTALVAAVQAIITALGENPESVRAVGAVERLWLNLDLMDNEE